MKPMGVNRVVIVVSDLEKGIELYSKLLGATFLDVSEEAEILGLRAAISFDAGVELCAPIPGRDSYAERFLSKRGEGLMGVVFAVDDVEDSRGKAEEMGLGVAGLIADYSQEEIDQRLEGRFKKYKEYMLDSNKRCGFLLILGQIEPK